MCGSWITSIRLTESSYYDLEEGPGPGRAKDADRISDIPVNYVESKRTAGN